MTDANGEGAQAPIVMERGRSLSILQVMNSAGASSGPYNDHSLPRFEARRTTACSFFPPEGEVPGHLRMYAGDGTLWGFLRILLQALSSQRFDVVHAQSPHSGFLFLLVASVRRPRLIRRTVYTVLSSYANYRWVHRLLMIPIFLSFGRLAFCSQASLASFPAPFRSLMGRRHAVVPNGVSVERVRDAVETAPARSRKHSFTIVTVGRLIQVKHPETIFAALADLGSEPFRFLFVGDGPLRAFVEAEIARRGLGARVEVTGMLPRDEVYARLAGADLFLSASHVEGLPLAVLECMLAEIPGVLSDIAPHREIAGGLEGITLVPVGDAGALTRAMRRWIETEPGVRRRVGAQGRRRVEAQFSRDAMYREYRAIYEELAPAEPDRGGER